jgi:hypothetical protein
VAILLTGTSNLLPRNDNTIWLREIDGLEGVKYTETTSDGGKRTVVKKNIVVITERKKEIPKGASQDKIDRINRHNDN